MFYQLTLVCTMTYAAFIRNRFTFEILIINAIVFVSYLIIAIDHITFLNAQIRNCPFV